MAAAPARSKSSRSAVCPGDVETFSTEMIKLVNEKEFSDIRFTVGEERQTIYGHKCLLAARCEVFRAMFATSEEITEDNQFGPLVLSDIQPKIFMAVMEFIYTNSCSLSTDMAIDVLAASIEYGLDALTLACVRFMRESVAIDTVCEFTQAALTYQQTTLQEKCLAFIEQNTKEVFEDQGFNELSEDALSFILQSDKLEMDEEDILAKVTEWANVNSVVTRKTLGEVAKKVICHVRFGLLDPEKLSEIENDRRFKELIPVPLISAAWKFHALKKVDATDPQTCPRTGTIPRDSLRVVGLTPP